MLSESSDLVEKLQSNVRQFRTAMASAGFKLSGHENCPIVPVMLGDARLEGGLRLAIGGGAPAREAGSCSRGVDCPDVAIQVDPPTLVS